MSLSFRKPKSQIRGSGDFSPPPEISIPRGVVGVSLGQPAGFSGNFASPLLPNPTELAEREEIEALEVKKEKAKTLILSIQDKILQIDAMVDQTVSTLYVKFDPVKYPLLSESTKFYTSGQIDNVINEGIYRKARRDLEYPLEQQKTLVNDTIRSAVNGENTGIRGVSEQLEKKKKFNVILFAFKQILGYIADWLFNLGFVKKALAIWFLGRDNLNDSLRRIGVRSNMVFDGERWVDQISRDELSDDELTMGVQSVHAERIISYLIGVIEGDEVALEKRIPNPDAILADRILLGLRQQFYTVVEMTNGFVDNPEVRVLGQRSAAWIPESVPYNRQVTFISRNLQPIFQEEYLKRLDKSLANLIRILQGWYLDPRTFCCLVNSLGGVSLVVPKWLHSLRFGLRYSMATIDFEINGLTNKVINLVNLIVQSILGLIVMNIHSYLNGWMRQKEHELLLSIMKSRSDLIRCGPFDSLVRAYADAFQKLLADMRSRLSALTGKLLISVDHYDEFITLLERRGELRFLLNVLDAFIESWEAGYICSQDSSAPLSRSPNSPSQVFFPNLPQGRIPIGSVGSVGELSPTPEIVPPITLEEMTNFLNTKLSFSKEDIMEVRRIYTSGEITQCPILTKESIQVLLPQ